MDQPSTSPALQDDRPTFASSLDEHDCDVVPLRNSRRCDVTARASSLTPALQGDESFVDRLRRFFADMDAEITYYADDPIATAQALARVDALLGDLRYIRDRLNRTTADALAAHQVRRLIVEGVVTVESSNEYKRTEWQHERILTAVLAQHDLAGGVVSPDTGERMDLVDFVALLLSYVRPEWKMTALREAGLNPDDYCTVERDDDNKPVKTPTLRIVDNRAKGSR